MLRRPATVIELQLDTDKAEYEQILREHQLRGQPLPAPTVRDRKSDDVDIGMCPYAPSCEHGNVMPLQEQQRPASVADRIGLAGQQAAAAQQAATATTAGARTAAAQQPAS